MKPFASRCCLRRSHSALILPAFTSASRNNQIVVASGTGWYKPEKAHEREPVADLELEFLMRPIIGRHQNDHFELQDRVVARPASVALLVLVPRDGRRLDVQAKALLRYDGTDRLKPSAFDRDGLEPLVDVEEACLSCHCRPPPPSSVPGYEHRFVYG